MSIQDYGAIGEFLGSIVVLITLVYLAIQTNITRKATQANLQWNRTNASRELALLWASNPDAANLIQEFGTKIEDLPDSDEFEPRRFRYLSMNRAVLELLQAFYLTAQTNADRELATNRVAFHMKIPGFQSSWPIIKNTGTFYPEFIELVDKVAGTNVSEDV